MCGLLDRFQRDVMLNYFVGDVIRRVSDDTQYFVLEPLYDVNGLFVKKRVCSRVKNKHIQYTPNHLNFILHVLLFKTEFELKLSHTTVEVRK